MPEVPWEYYEMLSFQDNCLLECRLKKITKACGCSPWYIRQDSLQVCTYSGNQCLEERLAM